MKKLARHMRWQKNYGYIHYVFYIIKNILFSIISSFLSKRKITYKEQYDVVFLARSEKSNTFEKIINNLPNSISYFLLKESSLSSIILRRKLFSCGARKDSLVFHIYELYSNYILKKYNPRLIVTDSNGSIMHPFLTKLCYFNNSKHVHLAHSIPTIKYRQFSQISYDYYLVYGKSSYVKIKEIAQLYGNTKFIFTGSHQINTRIANTVSFEERSDVFLLLGSGPGFEKNDSLTKKYYEMVINYVYRRPNSVLIFKPHPRSDKKLWENLIENLNEKKFIVSELFPRPSRSTKVAFCGYTNAILDVAKLGIIPCLMADDIENDFFNFKDYLFYPINDIKSLEIRVEDIIINETYYKYKLKDFISYHIENIDSPELYINEIIEEISDKGNADRFVNAEI